MSAYDELPMVSVIIPTHNRAEKLSAAVKSILRGEYVNVEVIVVDDASTDDTPFVCAGLLSADRRVRTLRLEQRSGAAVARNRGAEIARGELLLFSDDDVVSAPQRVGRLCRALVGHPDAGMAHCRVDCTDSSGETEVLGGGAWSATTSAVLLRRSVFEQVGGFDERLPRLQDFDLWTRVLTISTPVVVHETLARMTRDSTGISHSSERLNRAAKLLLAKYSHRDMPRRRLGEFHRRIAGKLVVGGGRLSTALHHLLKGFLADPLSFRTPAAIALLFCGRHVYTHVARVVSARASKPGRSG